MLVVSLPPLTTYVIKGYGAVMGRCQKWWKHCLDGVISELSAPVPKIFSRLFHFDGMPHTYIHERVHWFSFIHTQGVEGGHLHLHAVTQSD